MANDTNGKRYQWQKIPMGNDTKKIPMAKDINAQTRYQWQKIPVANLPMAKDTNAKKN